MSTRKKKKTAVGWYIVLKRQEEARVYAYHVDVSVILQAYANLKEEAKQRSEIVFAKSSESAVVRATSST